MAKSAADWEAIGRDYRAGVLSIREVGKLHDISDKAIRNRAKADGWDRDLSAKVAEKVRAELVRSESAPADKQTEREIVEIAAATQVQVVRGHRVSIRRMNEIALELIEELSVPAAGRIDGLKKLAETQKVLIGLERQAFNISDGGSEGDPTKPVAVDPTETARQIAFLFASAINKGK